MNVILASQSPRRKQLMGLLFDSFDIIPSRAEEKIPAGMKNENVPVHLALLKAKEVARRHPDSLVIASDTVVIADGCILGKPKDENDAEKMLSSLSGKTHTVVTGCVLQKGEKTLAFSDTAKVEFYPLTKEEIRAYIATGEPMDKAGAYGIQGKGALLVKGIEGDFYNVMGFPVALIQRKIKEFLAK